MDMRRIFILAGLAVSTYLLIITWNNDYEQKPVTANNQQINRHAPKDTANTNGEAPNVVVNDNVAETPDVLDAPKVLGKQKTGELVEVKTDVLNVQIDLVGGTIVRAELPKYPRSLEQQDVPFVLLENSNATTYVAQSGLLGKDGIDKNGMAVFQPEYQLLSKNGQTNLILSMENNKVKVEKIFTFNEGKYLIDIAYRIHNKSSEPWQGVFYAQLKRDGSKDPSAGSQMGMQSYLGVALTTTDTRYEKVTFDDLDDLSEKQQVYKSKTQGGWAAMLQHYFLTAWIAAKDEVHTFNGRKVKGNYLFGYYDKPVLIPAGEVGEIKTQLYVGPKIQNELGNIAEHLDLTVDYGWLWWIAKPIFWLMSQIQSLVGNWGLTIILLTLIIKLLFFPLSAASYRSMANMRKFAPKMQEIKELHGDNREKVSQEMMALYRKEKINPLGGCLPILIQMPVFISLYWVLMESVELRQSPFIFWIHDLSIKDPYFILPLLMGLSMFFQMKLNPTPPDPMQARIMQFMPVIFTVFFLWFPSGLVLYWLVNNILSIAQQYVITKRIENGGK